MHKSIIEKIIILAGYVLIAGFFYSPDNQKKLLRLHQDNKALQERVKNYCAAPFEKKLPSQGLDAKKLVKSAKKVIGAQYCRGGTQKCFDCSGLVSKLMKEQKITIGRDAQSQSRFGKLVLDQDAIKKGDLLFFHSTYKTKKLVTHVGIAVNSTEFIHSSSSKGVISSNLNEEYWSNHYLFAKRN